MALLPTVTRIQQGSAGKGNFLSYPSELGHMKRSEHYVMFFINAQSNSKLKYGTGTFATDSGDGNTGSGKVSNDPGTLSITRAETKQLSQAIALYMPNQISVSQKANYGEAEIGLLTAAAQGSIKGFANAETSVAGIAGEIANQGKKAFSEGVSEGILGAIKAADATVAPGAVAAFEAATGKVKNNRTEMKFEGIERRSFSFQFRLLPTSPEEAQKIEEIVTAFRYHSMPEIEGNQSSSRTMIMPSTFDIEYKPNTHLHRIATSVLESVEVSYGGERTQFFTDDQPVETSISLTFKELGIITKNQIAQGF